MIEIVLNTIVIATQIALFIGMGLGWAYVMFGFGNENINR